MYTKEEMEKSFYEKKAQLLNVLAQISDRDFNYLYLLAKDNVEHISENTDWVNFDGVITDVKAWEWKG